MRLTALKIPYFLLSALSKQCWYLIFGVTNQCNQRCRMCFNKELNTAQSDTLTLAEIKKIASFFSGLFQLTFSGGEPILREDLPEIVGAFNRKHPIPRITIPSNGQLPQKLYNTVRKIALLNPKSNINVALSLDGIGSKHDEIRGVDSAFECFERSKEAVIHLSKEINNVSLVVATTLSAFNQKYTHEILDYIEKKSDPAIHGIMLVRGRPKEAAALNINREDFLKALQALRQFQQASMDRFTWAWTEAYHRNRITIIKSKRMVDPCKAGSKLLVLTYDGFVWPCETLQEADGFPSLKGGFCCGNLRDANYNVQELLNSYQAQRIRKYVSNSECQCTFECALLNNFALNIQNYPKVFWHWLAFCKDKNSH